MGAAIMLLSTRGGGGDEKQMIFTFGASCKFLDSTSSVTSGKDSVYLLLCSLYDHVLIVMGNVIIVFVNSK